MVKRGRKEQKEPEAKEETEDDVEVDANGRVCRQKGRWKRGDVEAVLNTVNMTAWVHKECGIMDEKALLKTQEAWDNSGRKDDCILRLDESERAYWTGTEVGLLVEMSSRVRYWG
jgi:hypothetical protein